jgi:hypothetical protein
VALFTAALVVCLLTYHRCRVSYVELEQRYRDQSLQFAMGAGLPIERAGGQPCQDSPLAAVGLPRDGLVSVPAASNPSLFRRLWDTAPVPSEEPVPSPSRAPEPPKQPGASPAPSMCVLRLGVTVHFVRLAACMHLCPHATAQLLAPRSLLSFICLSTRITCLHTCRPTGLHTNQTHPHTLKHTHTHTHWQLALHHVPGAAQRTGRRRGTQGAPGHHLQVLSVLGLC